jgi:hypothetical protein
MVSFENHFMSPLESRLSSGSRIFNERNQKYISFWFQCQQSMPGSNEYLMWFRLTASGVCIKRKRLLQKAFRNKSVHTCLVKVLIFKWLLTLQFLLNDDVAFCKRLITEYGVAAIPISTFMKTEKTTI